MSDNQEALVQQIAEALRGWWHQPPGAETFWVEAARAVLPLVEAQVAPLRDEVRRFAKDAADVQTKWLAEEMRANAAEDDLRALRDRLAVMARRLEAEPFISETSARIARELRDLIPTPTAGGKVEGSEIPSPETSGAGSSDTAPEHDDQCEADFIPEASAYTPCRCAERADTAPEADERARLVAMERGASRRSQHPWLPADTAPEGPPEYVECCASGSCEVCQPHRYPDLLRNARTAPESGEGR
jgi:hypothetical protein